MRWRTTFVAVGLIGLLLIIGSVTAAIGQSSQSTGVQADGTQNVVCASPTKMTGSPKCCGYKVTAYQPIGVPAVEASD